MNMCYWTCPKENVIPKDRGRVHITPLLSVITYFVITNTHFNVVDLLIQYIESFTIIKDLNFSRKPNLALGHLIT